MRGTNVEVAGAPAIPGLRFRTFTPDDYDEMATVMNHVTRADEGPDAWVWTVEFLKRMDSQIPDFDPQRDRVIADVEGRMIGCGRVQHMKTLEKEHLYAHSFNLLPEWRRKGIGRASCRERV